MHLSLSNLCAFTFLSLLPQLTVASPAVIPALPLGGLAHFTSDSTLNTRQNSGNDPIVDAITKCYANGQGACSNYVIQVVTTCTSSSSSSSSYSSDTALSKSQFQCICTNGGSKFWTQWDACDSCLRKQGVSSATLGPDLDYSTQGPVVCGNMDQYPQILSKLKSSGRSFPRRI